MLNLDAERWVFFVVFTASSSANHWNLAPFKCFFFPVGHGVFMGIPLPWSVQRVFHFSWIHWVHPYFAPFLLGKLVILDLLRSGICCWIVPTWMVAAKSVAAWPKKVRPGTVMALEGMPFPKWSKVGISSTFFGILKWLKLIKTIRTPDIYTHDITPPNHICTYYIIYIIMILYIYLYNQLFFGN